MAPLRRPALAFRLLPAIALIAFAGACDEAPTPLPIQQVRGAAQPFPLLGERAIPAAVKVDEKTGFIIADGYVTVAQQCTVCHSAQLVTQNRGDREHWKSLIVWMQKTQGLWSFTPEQENTILTYLETHYGAGERGRRPPLDDALMPVPSATVDASKLKQAQAALTTLGGRLQTALKGAMPHGAPNAVQACSVAAPASVPDAPRLRAGRTSRRLRNATNVAPEWVGAMYESYEKGSTAPELSAALDDGGVGVVRPIYIKPMCLQCHGSGLSPDVQTKIDSLYPTDAATEYALGELRGVFWAEMR